MFVPTYDIFGAAPRWEMLQHLFLPAPPPPKRAGSQRAKTLRPVMTELANLPTRATVDILNRHKIRTAFGGRWLPTAVAPTVPTVALI